MKPSLLVGLVLVLVGCGSSDPISPSAGAAGSEDPGTGGSAFGGSGGTADHDSGTPMADAATTSGSPPCDRYLACVADTTPAGLDVVIAAYGKAGSCWAQGNEAFCNNACRKGIVTAHLAFPSSEACNLCGNDDDCPSSIPICDTATERCLQCMKHSDCEGNSKSMCDTSTNLCVQCIDDSACTNQDRPRCDPASKQCVACVGNEDCAHNGMFCDQATRECRPCEQDGECAPGVCEGGYCLECRSDDNCPSDRPRCGYVGMCMQCRYDSDCGGTTCNIFSGICCNESLCAFQGAECGLVFDLGCGLTMVDCGDCTGANLCGYGNKCVSKPNKTCSDQSCSTGACVYVPENNAYECVSPYVSCSENDADCGLGFACRSTGSGNDKVYFCTRQCLSNEDCTNGKTCTADGTTYGICE